MKLKILSLSALLAAMAFNAQAAEELYTIEPAHTYPSFEVSHRGISYWRGKFNKTSGKIWLDRANRTGRLAIAIDTASVNFGFAPMDANARSEEWFAVEKYPTANYVSDTITFKDDVPVSVDGRLTLRGVTVPVKLEIVEFHCMEHRFFKREVCGADVRADFDRRDFGMVTDVIAGNGKVRLQIQVEALKGDSSPMPPPGVGAPPPAPQGSPPASK